MEDEVLVVSISKTYFENMTDLELYEATNFCWEIAEEKRDSIKYVLASYKGNIKEVYKVQRWIPAKDMLLKTREIIMNDNIYKRVAFIGDVASDIREHIINKKSFKRLYGAPSYGTLSELENYYQFNITKNDIVRDLSDIYSLNTNLTTTDIVNLVKCRLGQGEFRNKLINYWNGCSVSKCNNIELLIASHIKPWSVSNNEERLDTFNGLLLLPNIDKLFDKGYISFNDNGKILMSKKINDYSIFGITESIKIEINDKHKKYLKYHRENIFRI